MQNYSMEDIQTFLVVIKRHETKFSGEIYFSHIPFISNKKKRKRFSERKLIIEIEQTI